MHTKRQSHLNRKSHGKYNLLRNIMFGAGSYILRVYIILPSKQSLKYFP